MLAQNTLIAALALLTATAQAQPYAIGNTTRTWYDAERMREVPGELHYPAVADGDDEAVADGTFPVLVVGHGFVMTVDAYEYLWRHFVPLGYIVILPTSEGGLSPDHAAFGADLAFAEQRMQAEGLEEGSLFFGHVAEQSALLGHSMGGGAALLGAEGNSAIQAVVDLAPAETNPSAIAAAAGILVPTLIFSGSEDCVTPLATNQQPMYDALTAPCKALVNVSGGGHCYFGDDNFLCSFGEFTCGPDLTVSRAQQHDVVTDLATLWLDHYLRGDASAFTAFQDSMSATSRATTQFACLSTDVQDVEQSTMSTWPSPANDILHITGLATDAELEILTATGARVARIARSNSLRTVDVSALPNGAYWLVCRTGQRKQVQQFVVQR